MMPAGSDAATTNVPRGVGVGGTGLGVCVGDVVGVAEGVAVGDALRVGAGCVAVAEAEPDAVAVACGDAPGGGDVDEQPAAADSAAMASSQQRT